MIFHDIQGTIGFSKPGLRALDLEVVKYVTFEVLL